MTRQSIYTYVFACFLVGLYCSISGAATKVRELGSFSNTEAVKTVAFSPNGQVLADGRLYGIEGEEKRRPQQEEEELTLKGREITGPVRLWDATSGRLLRKLRHAGGMVYSLAFSPDGKWLAVGLTNGFGLSKFDPLPKIPGQVKLWNTNTWKVAQTLDVAEANVYKLAFSSDNQRIAVGLGNCSVRLWNINSRRVERILWGHDSWMQTLCFSPDGQALALSGNYKGRTGVRIWSVRTGKLVRARLGESSVSWEPGSKRFATAISSTIRIWDAHDGRLLRQVRGTGLITQTLFSPDARWLAGRTKEGAILMWDRRTRALVCKLSDADSQTAAAFSPNALLLASGGMESTTYLWNLKPLTHRQF